MGTHQYVTFANYCGAPALGGARLPELRNPLMMLPPPPGFPMDAR
jgi:hypothetical protein